MGLPVLPNVTADEYLAFENSSDTKHEYFDGVIVAMAGTSFNHNFIFANLIDEIHLFLKDKKCNVFGSELRVATPFFSSYMYPDLIIVCDDLERQESKFDTLTNPSVIIEIMS